MNVPFGIERCCICDAPATWLGRATMDDALLPYCDADRKAVDAEFPGTQWFGADRKVRSW